MISPTEAQRRGICYATLHADDNETLYCGTHDGLWPCDGGPVTARPVGDGDGQDGLRSALAERLYDDDFGRGAWEDWLTEEDQARYMAKADTLLPVVTAWHTEQFAALRAKAAAADRVLNVVAFLDEAADGLAPGRAAVYRDIAARIRRALNEDGQPTTEESR